MRPEAEGRNIGYWPPFAPCWLLGGPGGSWCAEVGYWLLGVVLGGQDGSWLGHWASGFGGFIYL
jgi:hypothetical protein